MNETSDIERLIPQKEVLRLTSLSRTWIYRCVKNGTFPKPVRITEKRIAWVESEIRSWLDHQVKNNRVTE